MLAIRFSRTIGTTFIGCTLALLAGCTSGDADLKEWVAHEKAQKGAPIAPLPRAWHLKA